MWNLFSTPTLCSEWLDALESAVAKATTVAERIVSRIGVSVASHLRCPTDAVLSDQHSDQSRHQ